MTGTVDGFDRNSWTTSPEYAGTLTGTIATGNNPSVNITVRTGVCPNYSAQFSGAYDTPNRRLTITGPVDILSDACAILLRYQVTIILNR
jgi:hypothetical protein